VASESSFVQVHHRGDRGVDGILRLIELAGHDGPIEMTLTAMCDEIAAIAGVPIASVYVRERDRLVMRGNHGFPASAIGATTLAVGEGITGLVAECMRPVSAAHASTEAAYKHVPGLGEERYPVFVGIPLVSSGAVAGVLVLQRTARPFATEEVTLATALGAPVTLAIERRRATAVRSARLVGCGRAGGDGVVLGRAGVVPTTTAMAAEPAALEAIEVDRAIARLRDDLGRAVKRLASIDAGGDDADVGGALDRFALALCDQRLRERLVEAAARGGVPALRAVAKDYARAASDDDRVVEIEELCMMIGAASTACGALRPGAVWLADRIGGAVAIAAVARGASALVASDAATTPALAIARAARLPLVTEVAGVFNWVRPGDLLAVDATTGTVLVHPASAEIERLRRAR
jgi:phosphotransferase system enzyme I (PtsP)